MSRIVCPVCGSEMVHEYRKHGTWQLHCNACGYDSGDNWRDHAHHEDDDEREPVGHQQRHGGRQR